MVVGMVAHLVAVVGSLNPVARGHLGYHAGREERTADVVLPQKREYTVPHTGRPCVEGERDLGRGDIAIDYLGVIHTARRRPCFVGIRGVAAEVVGSDAVVVVHSGIHAGIVVSAGIDAHDVRVHGGYLPEQAEVPRLAFYLIARLGLGIVYPTQVYLGI